MAKRDLSQNIRIPEHQLIIRMNKKGIAGIAFSSILLSGSALALSDDLSGITDDPFVAVGGEWNLDMLVANETIHTSTSAPIRRATRKRVVPASKPVSSGPKKKAVSSFTCALASGVGVPFP